MDVIQELLFSAFLARIVQPMDPITMLQVIDYVECIRHDEYVLSACTPEHAAMLVDSWRGVEIEETRKLIAKREGKL